MLIFEMVIFPVRLLNTAFLIVISSWSGKAVLKLGLGWLDKISPYSVGVEKPSERDGNYF